MRPHRDARRHRRTSGLATPQARGQHRLVCGRAPRGGASHSAIRRASSSSSSRSRSASVCSFCQSPCVVAGQLGAQRGQLRLQLRHLRLQRLHPLLQPPPLAAPAPCSAARGAGLRAALAGAGGFAGASHRPGPALGRAGSRSRCRAPVVRPVAEVRLQRGRPRSPAAAGRRGRGSSGRG